MVMILIYCVVVVLMEFVIASTYKFLAQNLSYANYLILKTWLEMECTDEVTFSRVFTTIINVFQHKYFLAVDRSPLLPLVPGSGELVEANYVIRY